MLYAKVNANAWKFGWEEIESLEKMLRRLNPTYQVIAERRMFELQHLPEYRFVLLEWVRTSMNNKGTIVLETHDIQQMVSALKMLISIEKESASEEKKR
jgi:hypothetical protein